MLLVVVGIVLSVALAGLVSHRAPAKRPVRPAQPDPTVRLRVMRATARSAVRDAA